jgi:hypothetical protein
MAEDHEKGIRKALKHGDKDKAAVLVETAFGDDKAAEEVLAWVAGVAYENELTSVLGVIPEFLQRFPNSLHLIRVYYADLCAAQEQFDLATTHARLYIRLAREAGLLDQLEGHSLLQEGIGRSFLLLSSAYTELGARSYSRRVLEFGLEHDVHSSWKDSYKQERDSLAQELKEPEFKKKDEVWERFFKKGKGGADVLQIAKTAQYDDMTLRLECLEDKLKTDKDFRIGPEEMLMAVGKGENDVAILT